MAEKKYMITKEEAVHGDLPGYAGTFRIFIDGLTCGAKNVSVSQNTMNAGKTGVVHSHETEHCMFILSGTGTFKVDGQTLPIAPGSAFFVPPDVDHQMIVDKDSNLDYVLIYAPAGPEQKLREKGAHAYDEDK